MQDDEHLGSAFAVLRVTTQLLDGIQQGLARRGFDDVRPMHGFAFVRISAGDATVVDLADYLGVTKQAAGQLVEQLAQRGYLTRKPHPHDGRARLLALTPRGHACTRGAEAAAAETVRAWETTLGREDFDALSATLATLVVPGRLRPLW